MPSATQYYGYSVTNVGPLTTAFEAAPSCATTADRVYIETAIDDTTALFGFPSCNVPSYAGCLPNGDKIDNLARALARHPHNGDVAYHSPGLSCPDGWTTAGRVAGAAAGHNVTGAKGVFTELFTTVTAASAAPAGIASSGPTVVARMQAIADVLDPAETLAWCCPKGFTANMDAMCSSALGPFSEFTYSTRCEFYLPTQDLITLTPTQGSSLSAPVVVVTAAQTNISTSTLTIEPSETSGLVIVSVVPVVALVYRKEDVKGGESAAAGTQPGLFGVLTGLFVASLLIVAGL